MHFAAVQGDVSGESELYQVRMGAEVLAAEKEKVDFSEWERWGR